MSLFSMETCLNNHDKHSLKQFFVMEVVCYFRMLRTGCGAKVACDCRKQKPYRINRPLAFPENFFLKFECSAKRPPIGRRTRHNWVVFVVGFLILNFPL